jgi:hypothetical protein
MLGYLPLTASASTSTSTSSMPAALQLRCFTLQELAQLAHRPALALGLSIAHAPTCMYRSDEEEKKPVVVTRAVCPNKLGLSVRLSQ